MSDAYEDHFNLPGRRTLMITNERVMLLQVRATARGPSLERRRARSKCSLKPCNARTA